MRQFILAANAAYPSAISSIAAGQVGITYLKDGVETLVIDAATAAEIKGHANILWKNPNTKLGQIVYPIFKKNFTFTKGTYTIATVFAAGLTVGTPEAYQDYSIIVAKKGLKFNERNKWTSTVHTGANPTEKDVASKLANHINANSQGSGVKAVAADAKITITALEAGKDYEIVPADGLMGTTVIVNTQGTSAYGDAAYVADLAKKAAADAGFEYTYDDFEGLYPAYPLNPLAQADKVDAGFTIYTLRFAEPRKMKTRDEVVHQIIQIAYPTKSAAIDTMDKILDILAGGEVPASSGA